jgi:hypothetical protein
MIMNIEHSRDVSPSLWVSVKYFDEQLAELQRAYAGKWIALAGQSVRFANEDACEIHRQAIAECPNETLFIAYVPLPGEGPLDWK